MTDADTTYDVAIIGSGIGGSTLAAILARQGLSVLVLEAGVHPKFSVGESMILETSECMRALAKFYDVPELANFSSENYLDYAGTSHGIKRHFSFVKHFENMPFDKTLTLQAVIPREPYGHELHLYRQDTDSYLNSVAVGYGATVHQGALVIDLSIDEKGVSITTSRGLRFKADYLVDAGGYRSFVAEKLGWRHDELQTHTRGMFTHMIGVPCFQEATESRKAFGIPFRLSEGTLHHLFEGGWLWVIPFNNHKESTNPLCSVGLLLDPRIYPPRNYLSPEEEFRDFVARFPALAAQFGNAKAVRPWVRSDRLQYSSRHVVGDRFALLAHAAGFIDPLFSKGLYTTHMSVMLLADLLLKAKVSRDWSAAAFATLEKQTLDYIRMHDRIVSNSIKSWQNYELWRVYSVQWLLGAYLEYLSLSMARMRTASRGEYLAILKPNRLAGGGFQGFYEIQERVDRLFEELDPANDEEVRFVIAEAKRLLRSFYWLPAPFQKILDGKNHLPRRKFRLSLFDKQQGFMGSGDYRRHFFSGLSLLDLLRLSARDRIQYSPRSIRALRRTQGALPWQNPGLRGRIGEGTAK